MNFSSLRRMGTTSHVKGLPVLDQVDQLCDACLVGKHKRAPFPQMASRTSVRALELLHGDLCGLVSPATPSGNMFFLLLVDDYSRYMWILLMPSKDHAVFVIKRIQASAERKSGKVLGALRTDRGGEFTTAHFKEYCAELGVRRQVS
jgi:transposase InsO family protein